MGRYPPDLATWSQEILGDLLQILPVPEWGLNNNYCHETILPELVVLCQISYDIRLGLAEEDICGNIQLVVYPSDTQFQEDVMNNADTPPKVLGLKPDHLGDIAGTVGLGLRECVVNRTSQGISELQFTTLLAPAPDVILTRHVLASLKSNKTDKVLVNDPFWEPAMEVDSASPMELDDPWR